MEGGPITKSLKSARYGGPHGAPPPSLRTVVQVCQCESCDDVLLCLRITCIETMSEGGCGCVLCGPHVRLVNGHV